MKGVAAKIPHSQNVQSVLEAVTDDDFSTGVPAGKWREAIDRIDFGGGAPWINRVSVWMKGKGSVSLKATDLHHQVIELDYSTRVERGDDGVTRWDAILPDVRLTSLTPVIAAHSEIDDLLILEVSLRFFSYDPDNESTEGQGLLEERQPVYTLATSAVDHYKNSPCHGAAGIDVNVLSSVDGLADKLEGFGGWSRTYDARDASAREDDFHVNDNQHVDARDLVYVAGHGGPSFSHPNIDCHLSSSECIGLWGDANMEWIAFHSCQSLRSCSGWHGCMDGLHIICGWYSSCYGKKLGKWFGKYLTGYSPTGLHYKFHHAWFKAAKKSHGTGYIEGERLRPSVLAESRECFGDYLWGVGPVISDPIHDDEYTAILVHYPTSKTLSSTVDDAEPLRTLRSYLGGGPTILASEAELAKTSADSSRRFLVNPISVDSFDVRDLAQDFCAKFGILCGGTIFEDSSDGFFYLADGPYQLMYSPYGGWDITETDQYGKPTTAAPTLPSYVVIAWDTHLFLYDHGLLPADAYRDSGSYLEQSDYSDSTLMSSWPLDVGAGYYRSWPDRPVVGPGANIEFTYGVNSRLLQASKGPWRTISLGAWQRAVPLEAALLELANSAGTSAINGSPMADSIYVLNSRLGYYEPEWDTAVTELEMTWIVNATVVSGGETSEYTYFLPASHTHLCGDADGSGAVDISDPVSLIAYIFAGGAAPDPLWAGDANCDGSCDISDCVYLITYIFGGGPMPCATCK